MRMFRLFKDKLLKVYIIISSVAVVVLTISALIQVLSRYLLSSPPPWTEELARFMFVWATFLGAAVALDKGLHASITVLEDKLPPRSRRVLKAITTLMVLALALLLCGESFKLCMSTMKRVSPVMKIPMAYINVSLTLSSIGMALSSIDALLKLFRNDNFVNKEEIA